MYGKAALLEQYSISHTAEENKANLDEGVFYTESAVLDEILSVESGGSSSRLHGISDSGGPQHKEVKHYLFNSLQSVSHYA